MAFSVFATVMPACSSRRKRKEKKYSIVLDEHYRDVSLEDELDCKSGPQ